MTRPASAAPSVLFLVPYPLGKAPSQRFRVEAFLPVLDASGIRYEIAPFLTPDDYAVFRQPDGALGKVRVALRGWLRRFGDVWRARRFDYVFVHREAAPLGPPFFEWLLTRVFRKRLIFDFDDAIWMPDSSGTGRLLRFLKWHRKTGAICRWAHKVAAGNHYLADYAARHGAKGVQYLPTVVDTEVKYREQKVHAPSGRVTIGWTGSYSTLPYLDLVVPHLQALQQDIDFDFLVVADQEPNLPLRNVQFLRWSEATEASDLLRMDIGIMPLPDDEWAKGKCAFKIIQYLAVGLPAVASPVGANIYVIDGGINGYLCDGPAWETQLRALAVDCAKRQEMGRKGREKIETHYSLMAQRGVFEKLFSDNVAL